MLPRVLASSPDVGRPVPPWADDARLASNYLDVVRLALATLVIVGHSYDLVSGVMHSDPVGTFTSGRTSLASLSVDGFFAISGFLISASFLRSRGWRDYLVRRARRIHPGFAVANVVAPLLVASIGLAATDSISWPWELARVVGRTLLLDEYSPPDPFPGNVNPLFNGSLWTIRYEFLCYLLCGAILSARTGRRVAAALAIVTATTLIHALLLAPGAAIPDTGLVWRAVGWLAQSVPTVLDERWLRFLLCFGAGMTFHALRARLPRHPALAALIALIAIAVARWAPDALVYVTPLALTYVLFWVAFARPTALVHFSERFGDYSYGLYLYAFPVQQTVIAWLGEHATPSLVTLASLPTTLLFAIASWWLVERRFVRRRAQPGQ